MRSDFERRVGKELKKRKLNFEYESEKLTYTKEYKPDFIITTKSGSKIYIEVKGRFYPGDTTKMLSVQRSHPEKDIRFIFYRSGQRVRKGSTETMGEWADRHGFPWCELPFPKGWLNK